MSGASRSTPSTSPATAALAGRLVVRHFYPDFTAWEDKTEDVTLRLVKEDDDELHFGTISFYRRSEDHIDAYVLFHKDDEVFEQPLVYERVRSP